MFVVANLVYAIALVLRIIIVLESFCIIVSAALSWFPFRGNFSYFCYSMAELINRPVRRFIPPLGPLDIAPIVSILLLIFIDAFLVRSLFDLAEVLR